MQRTVSTAKSISLALAALAAATFALGTEASAWERERSAAFKGPYGGSIEREYRRAPGTFEGRRAYRGPYGGGYDVERHARWGGGSGEHRVYRERTYRDGTARSLYHGRAWDRDAGVYSRERERTFRDGTTRSARREITRLGEGRVGIERSFTDRKGRTRSHSRTVGRGRY